MGRDSLSSEHEEEEEEDYIDMEVSSSTFLSHSSITTSSHPTREFEFQMSSKSLDKELMPTSPADELFYKGKLLPLHLPPRLQMVEKLLHNSSINSTSNFELKSDSFKENFTTPLTTTTTTTPFASSNISPAESSQVSRELNPEEYFIECSTEITSFIDEHKRKSWAKKLKLIKQSSLGFLKLKASRVYLKSLFSKSSNDQSCLEIAPKNGNEIITISKAKECFNKYVKVGKKTPFGQIHQKQSRNHQIIGTDKEKMIEEGNGSSSSHRRSFSGAIKRNPATKSSFSSSESSSSSSLSSNSNGSYELHLLKRSNSANSEFESSIQGAIAHCKQSHNQQSFRSRKTLSEVGLCSFTASRISASDDQEIPELCRG